MNYMHLFPTHPQETILYLTDVLKCGTLTERERIPLERALWKATMALMNDLELWETIRQLHSLAYPEPKGDTDGDINLTEESDDKRSQETN